jgi:hypothetical protein
MPPDTLARLHQYAWDTFYADASREAKMARLFLKVIQKEMADGTHRAIHLSSRRRRRTDPSTPAANPTPPPVSRIKQP